MILTENNELKIKRIYLDLIEGKCNRLNSFRRLVRVLDVFIVAIRVAVVEIAFVVSTVPLWEAIESIT